MQAHENSHSDALLSSRDEENQLRKSLEQSVWEGSFPVVRTGMLCCTLLCIVPAALILLATVGELPQYLIYIGAASGGITLLALIAVCFPVFGPSPSPPPPTYPISKQLPAPTAPKRLYVFVNPVGGKKRAVHLFENVLLPQCTQAGIELERVNTEYAGHCEVLCKTLSLDGYDGIIAIGGDGTFHECVNGLLSRTDGAKVPIGLVPGGSGNSFLTDFNLQTNPRLAVEAIVQGRAVGMDAIKVTSGPDPQKHVSYSINLIGLSADHCMNACNIDGWRSILGTARYDVCGLWGLLKGRSSSIEVSCDGKIWEDSVSSLFVTNSQHVGKGMRASPFAKLDDGLMDLGSVPKSVIKTLKVFKLVHTGAHASLLKTTRAKIVDIRLPDDRGLFNLDGEVCVHHHNRLALEVVENAFDFFVIDSSQFQASFGKSRTSFT